MNSIRQALNRHFYLLFGSFLLLVILFGWWNSSRYSERYLHYVGDRSFEVFSASSLVRISFADGHIGSPGRQKGYRQRNARGKFVIRPVRPSIRSGSGLWEVTFGYWHLAVLGLALMGLAAYADFFRRSRGR